MCSRRLLAGVAVVLFSSAASQAQSPAAGPQYIVNATTADAQRQSVAARFNVALYWAVRPGEKDT